MTNLPKKSGTKTRIVAATLIEQVIEDGLSLSAILPPAQATLSEKDRALLQELCFGTLRTLPQLTWIVQQLMKKPLTGKQRILHYLLLVGLYQLIFMRVPAYAAVDETINSAIELKKSSLKGLLNAVLREFLRQKERLLHASMPDSARYWHPDWLLARLKHAYPDTWLDIVDANNQKAPIWLRVNLTHHTAKDYQALLAEKGISSNTHSTVESALRLNVPTPITQLPGFNQGWVTVQDVAAQMATYWLAPKQHEKILDLCAAPGGKTTHILELAPLAQVVAVDCNQLRMVRLHENLARLNQHADVRIGDATQPETWCSGEQFDRILVDAPCSATGVIRRHPDIKWLRHDNDIEKLAQLQAVILHQIWAYLKPGGVLIYTTCSILPQENNQQITHFMMRHADALLVGDTLQQHPNKEEGDGFFYAKIEKMSL